MWQVIMTCTEAGEGKLCHGRHDYGDPKEDSEKPRGVPGRIQSEKNKSNRKKSTDRDGPNYRKGIVKLLEIIGLQPAFPSHDLGCDLDSQHKEALCLLEVDQSIHEPIMMVFAFSN